MARYAILKLIYSVPTLLAVLTLVFVLEKLLLGDQSHRRVGRFDLVEESEGAA